MHVGGGEENVRENRSDITCVPLFKHDNDGESKGKVERKCIFTRWGPLKPIWTVG